MFKIEITAFGGCPFEHLPDVRAVFRMGALNGQFVRGLDRRLAIEDAEGFIGPIDLSARNVPAETAGAAEPLRLRQVSLTSAQSYFSTLAFFSLPGFAERAVNRWDKSRQ